MMKGKKVISRARYFNTGTYLLSLYLTKKEIYLISLLYQLVRKYFWPNGHGVHEWGVILFFLCRWPPLTPNLAMLRTCVGRQVLVRSVGQCRSPEADWELLDIPGFQFTFCTKDPPSLSVLSPFHINSCCPFLQKSCVLKLKCSKKHGSPQGTHIGNPVQKKLPWNSLGQRGVRQKTCYQTESQEKTEAHKAPSRSPCQICGKKRPDQEGAHWSTTMISSWNARKAQEPTRSPVRKL